MTNKFFGTLLVVISMTTLVGCTQQKISGDTDSAVNDANTEPQVEVEGNDELVGDKDGRALKIVSTFLPLHAHVANIIDGNDAVTNLVPAGTSIHTRQPRPSDVLAIEEADVIITNGLGLEEFLGDYLDDLHKKGVTVVDTSAGVELMEFEEEEDEHDDHDEEHHHDGPDPHIRLDPANAKVQVSNIARALMSLDPSQEEFYTQQASAYTKTLDELDTRIQQQISDADIQPFIVFHDAYQYFLQAYGLQDSQVGLVQEFHGDNPSQKEIAKLIETIKKNSVKIIYTEPQFNPSVVDRLEKETGVKTRETDPIGSNQSKDGYITAIEKLAEAFAG